jgi:hypothetical protein
MTRGWGALAVVALTGVVSCKPDVFEPRSGATIAPDAGLTSDAVTADLVSKAIAAGLRDPSQRHALREAFRASPLTEHKVVLQDFIQTPTGQSLLRSASEASGIAIQNLSAAIASLPPIDFYVSSRKHRREWDGNSAVVVGAAMGAWRAEVNGYSQAGNPWLVTQQNWERGPVVILMHPAEAKSTRVGPQPSQPGDAIESPGERTLSATLASGGGVLGTSASASLNVDGLSPRRLDECGDNCGGSMTPTDTTFLEFLVIIGVCDNGNCSEGNEFEWHTYFSTNSGSTWTDRTDLRIEGVPSNIEQTIHLPAIFKKPRSSTQMIQSDVVETDFWSGDDHFGSPQWHYSESGFLKSEGSTRCGWPKYYGGYYDCGTPYFWSEVNQSMLWHNF